MTEKNILLIDDEETIQEVVQVGIEIEAGWQVAIASSGQEGINLAQNQQPDAILLDVMMPDMDGIATLSHLKANAKTRKIPVIFLTAKTQAVEEDQFQGLVLQAVDPDLLILDIEMPHLSGIELCKVLRTHAYWCQLPVLFLSVHSDPNISNQVFASGANDFINKPVEAQQLAHRILNRLVVVTD